ncbi:MAG: hypothetical protein ACT4PL_14480 [Phycisphaerales bacterium]
MFTLIISLSFGAWSMLAGAVVAAGMGVVVLARARRDAGHRATKQGETLRPSAPTVYSTGVALLILAYHLIAWALPAGKVLLQVPASLWWALLLGLGGLVALARWMDALEREPGEPSGD